MVLLRINEGFIDVEEGKIFREKDLEDKDDVYAFFLSLMKPEECCYLLYDCHYETVESPKEELVFVMWAPDTAKVGLRMQYATSKRNLAQILTGIKHILEINCPSDYADKEDFAKKIGGTVVKVEGNVCMHHN